MSNKNLYAAYVMLLAEADGADAAHDEVRKACYAITDAPESAILDWQYNNDGTLAPMGEDEAEVVFADYPTQV